MCAVRIYVNSAAQSGSAQRCAGFRRNLYIPERIEQRGKADHQVNPGGEVGK
jgi:hypothetical protein